MRVYIGRRPWPWANCKFAGHVLEKGLLSLEPWENRHQGRGVKCGVCASRVSAHCASAIPPPGRAARARSPRDRKNA